ncbi:MAG: hypothetical protein ACE1ZD_02610 [Dehalococcoidia bacterium]
MALGLRYSQRDSLNRLLPLLAIVGQAFLTIVGISIGVAVVLIGVWQILS